MTVILGVLLRRDPRNWRHGLSVGAGPNTGMLIFGLTSVVSLISLTGNPWLICVAAALVGLLVNAVLQWRPDRVELVLEGAQTVAAGEGAPYVLKVSNLGRRPTPALILTIEMTGVGPVQRIVEPLRPRHTHQQPIELCALTRCAPRTAMVQVVTADPLQLISLTLRAEAPVNLLVHPAKVAAPGVSQQSSGELPQQRSTPILGQDPAGLRPYRRGDTRRAIHWRSTARRDQVVVVEREDQVGLGQVVLVAGAPRTLNDELTIASAAALAVHGVQDGRQLALLAWDGGKLSQAPLHQPQAILNWFSRNTFDLPEPGELVGRLPVWARSVSIAAPTHVPQPWRRQVEMGVAARGGEVTWLGPGRIAPEHRAIMATAWEMAG